MTKTFCDRCKVKIIDAPKYIQMHYPILEIKAQEGSGVSTHPIDLCHKCRVDFMKWMALDETTKELIEAYHDEV